MTDRTKADISETMTVECKNCLNDDPWTGCADCWDVGSPLFMGLRKNTSKPYGYDLVLGTSSKLDLKEHTEEYWVKNLLKRIDTEYELKGQKKMFNGSSIETVYK